MTTGNDVDLIEKYFSHELDSREANDLKHRAQSSKELQAQFEVERALVHGIRVEAAKADLNFLKGVEQQLARKESANGWYYYAAAASVALLIAAWFVLSPPAASSSDLFAAHFEPYPNVIEPVVRGSSSISARELAFQAYEAGDFAQARAGFEQLTDRDAGTTLLMGNALLADGETALAIQTFSDLIETSDEYDAEATWYLGLCYLKKDDTETATYWFNRLASRNSPYAAKARRVLDELH